MLSRNNLSKSPQRIVKKLNPTIKSNNLFHPFKCIAAAPSLRHLIVLFLVGKNYSPANIIHYIGSTNSY